MTMSRPALALAVSLLALAGGISPTMAQALSGPPSSTSTVAPPWQDPDQLPPGNAPPGNPPAPPQLNSPPTTVAPPPPPLGTVSPIRGSGRPECREFQQTIMIGGEAHKAYGTACRQPDGTWRIIR